MQITYAITACNEAAELESLLRFLKNTKRKEDEIVILLDNPTPQVQEVCNLFTNFNGYGNVETDLIENCTHYNFELNGDFAQFKNYLIQLCDGDYILQIDADERPSLDLILDLHEIIRTNPSTDVFAIARINTVKGITEEDIEKWNWKVNQYGYINYPDHQLRLWRNTDKIRFKNKVHEQLSGHSTITALPAMYFLLHEKTIEKQRLQNKFYDTLQ